MSVGLGLPFPCDAARLLTWARRADAAPFRSVSLPACPSGWRTAALPPSALDRHFRETEAAWSRSGRSGRPWLLAEADVALGPQPTLDEARRAWHAEHAPAPGGAGFTSRRAPGHLVTGLLTTRNALRDAVAGCLAMGADEVLLRCWSPDPDQVERIADAVFPEDGDWPGLSGG